MPRRRSTATEDPSELTHLAASQAGLVDLAQCRAHGLGEKVVRGLLARREWLPAARGVYELRATATRGPAQHPADVARCRSAWLALLACGPESIGVGACALALHGVRGLPDSIVPEAAVPGGAFRSHRADVRVRQFDDGISTVALGGRRIVTLPCALAQAVPELPRRNGLAVLDDVAHRRLLDSAAVAHAHDLARGRRGVGLRHDLWVWADPRAESPLESFARLDCIDAGVPPDVLQLPFRDASGHAWARGDMAWRRVGGRWLVAEIDGVSIHGTPDAVYADRRRQNSIVRTGAVDLLRFTARDLGSIASTVRSALRG